MQRVDKAKDEMGDLARSFNVMADSVAESFKRLDEARVKAEEANRTKSAFLASVSHELRTPLNGILGFAELLEAEAQVPGHDIYARTIHDSGKHLLQVVNDLLDLSKIEAGRMQLANVPFPLAPVVEEMAGLHRGEAEAKGLVFQLSLAEGLPAEMRGDPTRLRQVLNNLLNNAVKFTRAGRVGLTVAPEGERIAFTVSDTGCGIAPACQALVFEKFKQLENFDTRNHGGTGLGLALVKEFAAMMGGEVHLESEQGAGSSFTLVLPREWGG